MKYCVKKSTITFIQNCHVGRTSLSELKSLPLSDVSCFDVAGLRVASVQDIHTSQSINHLHASRRQEIEFLVHGFVGPIENQHQKTLPRAKFQVNISLIISRTK